MAVLVFCIGILAGRCDTHRGDDRADDIPGVVDPVVEQGCRVRDHTNADLADSKHDVIENIDS
ncbi:hypothetical protein SDC9_156979 [bioreactor metagenome]|uniref:Uncharacterized protein n=1 Tax=bioreactor metagenome TaxID=1076179 RepID=A0A645F675_9ZZZZ